MKIIVKTKKKKKKKLIKKKKTEKKQFMSKHYRLLKKNIKKSLVIGKWKISTEEDV